MSSSIKVSSAMLWAQYLLLVSLGLRTSLITSCSDFSQFNGFQFKEIRFDVVSLQALQFAMHFIYFILPDALSVVVNDVSLPSVSCILGLCSHLETWNSQVEDSPKFNLWTCFRLKLLWCSCHEVERAWETRWIDRHQAWETTLKLRTHTCNSLDLQLSQDNTGGVTTVEKRSNGMMMRTMRAELACNLRVLSSTPDFDFLFPHFWTSQTPFHDQVFAKWMFVGQFSCELLFFRLSWLHRLMLMRMKNITSVRHPLWELTHELQHSFLSFKT